MIYGYARVSSKGQMLYGTSLDDQEAVLIDNGAVEGERVNFEGEAFGRPVYTVPENPEETKPEENK